LDLLRFFDIDSGLIFWATPYVTVCAGHCAGWEEWDYYNKCLAHAGMAYRNGHRSNDNAVVKTFEYIGYSLYQFFVVTY